MSERALGRLAWFILGLSVLLVAVSLPLLLLNIPKTGFSFVPFFVSKSATLVYVALGALIAWRQPRNIVGWILLVVGASAALDNFSLQYVLYGFVTSPGSLPLAGLLAWLGPWLFQPLTILLTLFLLLFPDGRPPTPRWLPLVWIIVAAMALGAVGSLLSPSEISAGNQGIYHEFKLMPNPTAVPALAGLMTRLQSLYGLLVFLVAIGVLASLVWRLRRGKAEEREQVKWLAYATGVFCAIGLVDVAVGRVVQSHWVGDIGWALGALTVVYGFPAAATVAILKYHLYDIDFVINKSLVFGTLALFIAAVYVGMVAGIGVIIGAGDRPNLTLSILATAIVAVAFQTVRERVERLANRLVYGKRATPYEVLAQFSDRVAGTYASEEILPRMARVLAEGTAAARADVWIRLGGNIASAASWPSNGGPARTSLPLNGQVLPTVPGVTRVVPVRHQGELLGALSINKRPGETLTPVEDKLLKDLAAQAGLVLRNVRLTAQLRARLEEISGQANELRASRQRIVAAQDAERRRLERNIHDGAQQHLVALTVKLRLAASQARRDSQQAMQTVQALAAETGEALDTIHQLARGIYPEALRDKGLVAAIQAHAGRMELPVDLQTNDLKRHDPDTEAAIYFTVLEALQNVSKHADARRVGVVLGQQDGAVVFSVTDDGKGFDPTAVANGSGLQNMADRVEALGGTLTVSAMVGRGTSVNGRVPASALEPIT